MKRSQPFPWLILPSQRDAHLLLPKDYRENRRAKASLEVNSSGRNWHPTLFGPNEAVIVGVKTGRSWSSSDLSEGSLPKPEQCKYPYCKLALGSLRH